MSTKGKRLTLVHDRFQACCKHCGLIAAFSRKSEAVKCARDHANTVCFHTEVFDCMMWKEKNPIVWTSI
jgi:hypothetical protein